MDKTTTDKKLIRSLKKYCDYFSINLMAFYLGYDSTEPIKAWIKREAVPKFKLREMYELHLSDREEVKKELIKRIKTIG